MTDPQCGLISSVIEANLLVQVHNLLYRKKSVRCEKILFSCFANQNLWSETQAREEFFYAARKYWCVFVA